MSSEFYSNWITQFRKGVLELCVLNAIAEERLYGYEIVKKLRDIEGLMIREGTIYPILSRFRREGLVETSLQESQEGPPRKYYELTTQGRRQLTEMNDYWRNLKKSIDSLSMEKQP